MEQLSICLPNAEVVQEFANTLTGLDGDFELVAGDYILDARSLMGIFSFDLSKPITLRIYHDSETTRKALQRFTAETPSQERE